MGYIIKTNGELYHFGVPGMQWAKDKLKYGRQLTREEYNKLYAKAHARANGLRANMRGIKRTAQLKGYGQLGAAKALASPYVKRAAAGIKSGYDQARGAAEGYLNKRRATKNAAAAQERGRSYTSELQRRANAERYKKHQDALAKQREYERMTSRGKVQAAQLKAERHRARINADPFLKRKEEGYQTARRAASEARRKQEFLERKNQGIKRAQSEAKRKQEFLDKKKSGYQAARRAASEAKRKQEFLDKKKSGYQAARAAASEARRKQEFLDNKKKGYDIAAANERGRRRTKYEHNKIVSRKRKPKY